jgi:chromate transport protein ChrA
MPVGPITFALIIAAVVLVGASLDKLRVRRSIRVAIWIALALSPFALVSLFFMLWGLSWHYC